MEVDIMNITKSWRINPSHISTQAAAKMVTARFWSSFHKAMHSVFPTLLPIGNFNNP